MKKIKKAVCILLSLAIILPCFAINGFCKGDKNTISLGDTGFMDENSIIIFVTGIGQSWSYYFDSEYAKDGFFESGTLSDYENWAPLIAEGKYSKRWNLFNDLSLAFENKDTKRFALKMAFSLIKSIFTRKCSITREDIDYLINELFQYNIPDESGKCSPQVVTARYCCPVSEYPGIIKDGEFKSEAKNRFYRCIPCENIARQRLGENFEDYLYCFTYSPFSYISDNIESLHSFITECLANNKVGAKDVVLVPMSMGATVVNSYLAKYPLKSENYVKRVVSIVGCWQGSQIISDLLTQSWADNSEDLFYNDIWYRMLKDDPTVPAIVPGIVKFALKLFPKDVMKRIVKDAVGSLCDNLILKAPSLCALVPGEDYEKIRQLYKTEKIKQECDFYQAAQSKLFERFDDLKSEGIDFSFICGYGLSYGEVSKDYYMFGFMKSANASNGDEILEISTTAPGTVSAPAGKQITASEGMELSFDKSIDISNTFFKDSTWYFYRQKHELEDNEKALTVAIELALGNIKSVNDSPDFPQWN